MKATTNLLFGLCLAVLLSGCNSLVKTVKVPVNQPALYPYLNKRPEWTLEDASHKIRQLTEVSIRRDSVFGVLHSVQALDHPAGKKGTFSKWNWRNSMLYLHLNTSEEQPSEVVSLPLSSITQATIHKKDIVGNMTVTVLILFTIFLIYNIDPN